MITTTQHNYDEPGSYTSEKRMIMGGDRKWPNEHAWAKESRRGVVDTRRVHFVLLENLFLFSPSHLLKRQKGIHSSVITERSA